MEFISDFNAFVSESKEISGKEVSNYVLEISPEGSVPYYFIDKYIRPNRFSLEKVNISDLMKSDPDLKEYINSGNNRYDEYDDIDPKDIDLPIVVYKGMVLDGYNRCLSKYSMGEDLISAYIHK